MSHSHDLFLQHSRKLSGTISNSEFRLTDRDHSIPDATRNPQLLRSHKRIYSIYRLPGILLQEANDIVHSIYKLQHPLANQLAVSLQRECDYDRPGRGNHCALYHPRVIDIAQARIYRQTTLRIELASKSSHICMVMKTQPSLTTTRSILPSWSLTSVYGNVEASAEYTPIPKIKLTSRKSGGCLQRAVWYWEPDRICLASLKLCPRETRRLVQKYRTMSGGLDGGASGRSLSARDGTLAWLPRPWIFQRKYAGLAGLVVFG